MATIAIPLVTAALGSLGPLIAKAASGLINVAEAYLPKGTKLDAVLAGVEAFLAPLGTSGAIQQTVPTTTQLSSTIEGVLAKMKADGTLVPALSGLSTTAPSTASPAAIGTGQTVNLPIKISFGV